MAIRLKELERRSYARSLRAGGTGQAFGLRAHALALPRHATPAVPFSRGRPRALAASGLEAKLIAGGVAPEKAAELVAEIAKFDAGRGPASAMSVSVAMSHRIPVIDNLPQWLKRSVLYSLTSMTPFGIAGPLSVEAIFAACDQLNICIAFGIGIVGGVVGGGGGAAGIVFAPNREMGVFGSLGVILGEIADISVGAQFMVVGGGLSRFDGRSYTIGGAIGEVGGISGHFILAARPPGDHSRDMFPTAKGEIIGIVGEVDLRGGAPIRLITGAWETRSVTTGFSARQFGNGMEDAGNPPACHSAPDVVEAQSYARPFAMTSFNTLAGVPVHYDRLKAPNGYGSAGEQRNFRCTQQLADQLEDCMTDLLATWNEGTPSIILSAGTMGDGANAHGQGLAFDLDGFHWANGNRFMMDEYPSRRSLYLGVNAHLFRFFPQVLSYHYPGHKDHFHVDFNQSGNNHFRTGSQAQTYFLQGCLKYLWGQDLGTSGPEKDGVDGGYGKKSKDALAAVLPTIGMAGKDITRDADWQEFLGKVRDAAF